MNKESWDNLIKDLKLKDRPNQYEFYRRTNDFLLDKNDMQINQGGMGLGKTLAIATAISENKNNFTNFFIATPTAILKSEWAKEFNTLKLQEDYCIWIAKVDCCIEKIKDSSFDLKLCKDDCKFRNHLESNKEYNETCFNCLSNLKFPLNIEKYYKNNFIKSNCLLPITRCGLKNRKILVGDYFGYLFPKMYDFIVDKPTNNSCLIIDEAHLIPQRVSSLLSKSINLRKYIEKIREEIHCDYVINNSPLLLVKLENTLNIFKEILNRLIKIAEASFNYEGRYTFKDFLNDYDKYLNKNCYHLKEFIFRLKDIANKVYNSNEYESNEDSHCSKLVRFMENWESKYYNENYGEQFQYFKGKDKSIILKVTCKNPAEYLCGIWNRWEKVILMSGTLDDKKYFSDMLGLQNFNIIYESKLDSYSIKDNVIIYPKGSFIKRNRIKTLQENKELLNKVIKNLGGKTIIYCQTISASYELEKILDSKYINFCVDNKEKLPPLKEKFAKEKNCVGIINITGRVEGQNFIDIEGKTVNNIIIYGFPFARRNLEFRDKLEYWTSKLNNSKVAKEYVEFRPISSTIFQACMRSKRDAKDNPIIILWGDTFSKGSPGHKYSYDDLKGKIIYEELELLNEIKKRENDRNR